MGVNGTLSKSNMDDLPNKRDNDGFTPLHAACERGHVHCIKVLVKCGAAINAKDLSGRRPIRIHKFNINHSLKTTSTTHNTQ